MDLLRIVTDVRLANIGLYSTRNEGGFLND